MNLVFQKTRELGDALLQSEEYQTMHDMEQKAMANAEAVAVMGQYMERRQEVEALLEEENPASERLRALSDEMDALQERLGAIEDVKRMTEAREQFSTLIQQVNKVLQFIVTGEMQSDEESGCTGSCDHCAGCHHDGTLN